MAALKICKNNVTRYHFACNVICDKKYCEIASISVVLFSGVCIGKKCNLK